MNQWIRLFYFGMTLYMFRSFRHHQEFKTVHTATEDSKVFL